MGEMNSVLSLRNISKSFGKQKVLNNISLDIGRGTIFGIVGSSGSGKSTLLNIITGNLSPDTGDLLFEPKDLARYNLLDDQSHLQSVHRDFLALKRTVGYSSQDPSFYDKLTCKENIDFFGSLYKLPKDVLKINSQILLKLVGLDTWTNKLAGDLSGGMQKRLDLACSLVHDPKILVLDEPTADLDFILREQMWNLIQKIKQKGTTVVMSSHFIDEIESICDQIIILNNSRIEFIGSPEELKKKKNAGLVLRIQTVEKDYSSLKKKIMSVYRSKSDLTFKESSGSLVLTLKGVKKEEVEISKLLDIVHKSKQKIINFNFTREGISEVFQGLQTQGLNLPPTKKNKFSWFKKNKDASGDEEKSKILKDESSEVKQLKPKAKAIKKNKKVKK